LRAAVAEAQKWKFKVFELWDPSEEQQKWAREVSPCFTVVQRTKNLSSLAFWGLETKEPLEWKYNEQHCWV
jgi:hypothetical protein